MIGHEPLMRLRAAGYSPGHAFLIIADPVAHSIYSHPDMAMANGGYPEIEVHPQELFGALDLRCIAGMDVHVCGKDARQVKALFDRAVKFRPKTITAAAGNSRGLLRYEGGEVKKLGVSNE